MGLTEDLLHTLPDAWVEEVRVGALWTAVIARRDGQLSCGLASSLHNGDHSSGPQVWEAGHLAGRPARELAQLALSDSQLEVAIGLATINASLPSMESCWRDAHAAEVLASCGAGRQVALIGHFPFVSTLREQVGKLWTLELRPKEGDLPASAAAEILPQADVLALTATTLINGTFADLMALRRPDALVLLVGPSTPLSPRLFDHGIHILSGAVVQDIDPVLQAVGQGANFRQVRRAGVRLVTVQRLPVSWTSPEADEIATLKAQLADLQARMPAHSIPPSMFAELDELEERLAELQAQLPGS